MKKTDLIHSILLEYASMFGYEFENYSILPLRNASLYHGSFSRLPLGSAGPSQLFKWSYYDNDTNIRLCKQDKDGFYWKPALLIDLNNPNSLKVIKYYFSDAI